MLLRFPTMRTFRCLSCDRPINFDDGTCPHCGAVLGFIPGPGRLVSLLACDDGTWRVTPDAPWDYHPGVLERLFGARSRVVEPEDLLPAAREIADRIAANPPITVRMTKKLLRESSQQTLDQLLELSATMQAIAHHTEDHREALQSWFEKRPAQFQGR